MRFFALYIVILIYATPVLSQEPQFSWGERLKRNFGQLEEMRIVGVDKDGFFATYTVNDQITLEHYDPQHKRFWTTALLPKTPDGQKASFVKVKMLKDKLYMLSSSTGGGETQVYSQEISHSGNYVPEISVIAQAVEGDKIILESSANDAATAIMIANNNRQHLTLLTDELKTNWSTSIVTKGTAEELLVLPDGTVYLLVKASAAAPATQAFYLYQFNGQTGQNSELALGHTNYRPLKAKLAATPNGNVVVTGYMSPSNSVASQDPEPIGTFLYRIEKRNLHDRFEVFIPFSKKFISEYKRFKPDFDSSQRLRHLRLDRVIPLRDGGLYMLGEVCPNENRAGTFIYHNNDIIVVRLHKDGTQAFTTSINKLQSGTNKFNTIRSFFAEIIDNSLRLLYLDFEYNYKENDRIAMYSPRTTLKTPVMVTIASDGKQEAKPLHHTQTGREHGFYLRPSSAYKLSEKEYIVIGMGPEFYRYGRMTF